MLKLRRLVEGMLGIEPVGAGEDTQWSLRLNIGWPDWVIALFVLFAVAFVVSIYLREGHASRKSKFGLASVRLLILGLAVLMLGGLELSIDRTGLPYLVILLDDSESMGVRDRPAGATAVEPPTRLQKSVDWLARDDGRRLQELTARYKLSAYAIASAPRLLGSYISDADIPALLDAARNLEPTGAESLLGDNLRAVLNQLRGTPPSALVVFSDGVTTRGETLAQVAPYAARKNVPVFAIGVGDPERARDLELTDLLVDDTVFVNDLVTLEARLVGRGLEGREVPIVLKQKGADAPLDQKTIQVPADGAPVKVRLSHDRPSEPGVVSYVVETPTVDREQTAENNRLERDVRVIDEKIRVLYVETYPRYEFRYLKHQLEREATIALQVLLLEADPDYPEQDRSAIGYFPTSREELFSFDVLILGDVPPQAFTETQLKSVEEFVRVKGGGLLMVAGRNFAPQAYRETPVEKVLPIRMGSTRNAAATPVEATRPRLTLEGRSSPIFQFVADDEENDRIWNHFPGVYWIASVENAKPGAQVLVEDPNEQVNSEWAPIVATQFYGAGRSYFQGFDSTWRWRYRAEETYHAHYWVQVVRFLSRAKLLGKNRIAEVMTDRRKYRRGEPVQARVRFIDESRAPRDAEPVVLRISRGDKDQAPIELKRAPGQRSVYEGVFNPTKDGAYRARLAGGDWDGSAPVVDFVVAPPPGELDRVQLNQIELQQLATLTGGKYVPIDRADDAFASLPAGRRVALQSEAPIALWNSWPMLLLIIGALALEWIVRKRQRML